MLLLRISCVCHKLQSSWLSIMHPLFQQRGRTPLYLSSRKGQPDVVTKLLERGADVNHRKKVRYGYISSMEPV